MNKYGWAYFNPDVARIITVTALNEGGRRASSAIKNVGSAVGKILFQKNSSKKPRRLRAYKDKKPFYTGGWVNPLMRKSYTEGPLVKAKPKPRKLSGFEKETLKYKPTNKRVHMGVKDRARLKKVTPTFPIGPAGSGSTFTPQEGGSQGKTRVVTDRTPEKGKIPSAEGWARLGKKAADAASLGFKKLKQDKKSAHPRRREKEEIIKKDTKEAKGVLPMSGAAEVVNRKTREQHEKDSPGFGSFLAATFGADDPKSPRRETLRNLSKLDNAKFRRNVAKKLENSLNNFKRYLTGKTSDGIFGKPLTRAQKKIGEVFEALPESKKKKIAALYADKPMSWGASLTGPGWIKPLGKLGNIENLSEMSVKTRARGAAGLIQSEEDIGLIPLMFNPDMHEYLNNRFSAKETVKKMRNQLRPSPKSLPKGKSSFPIKEPKKS